MDYNNNKSQKAQKGLDALNDLNKRGAGNASGVSSVSDNIESAAASAGEKFQESLANVGGMVGGHYGQKAGGALGRSAGSDLGRNAGDYVGGKVAPHIDSGVSAYNTAIADGASKSEAGAAAGRAAGDNLGDTIKSVGDDVGNKIQEGADALANTADELGYEELGDDIRHAGDVVDNKIDEFSDSAKNYVDERAGDLGEKTGGKLGELSESDNALTGLNDVIEPVKDKIDEAEELADGLKDEISDEVSELATETLGEEAVGAVSSVIASTIAPALAAMRVARVMGAKSIMPLILVIAFCANIFFDTNTVAKYEPAPYQPNINCFDEWYNQYQALFGLNHSNLNEGAASADGDNAIINRLKDIYGYQTGLTYDSVKLWEDDTDGERYNRGKHPSYFDVRAGKTGKDVRAFDDGNEQASTGVSSDASGTYSEKLGIDMNNAVESVGKITPELFQSYWDESDYNLLENIMRIRTFFRNYGLTDIQIAVMIGSAFGESAVDPAGVETVFDEIGVGVMYQNLSKTDGDAVIDTRDPSQKWDIAEANYDPKANPDLNGMTEYWEKYNTIEKLGLGILGFTDAGGATNHTDLRKYALKVDYEIKRIDILMRLGYQFIEELETAALDAQKEVFGDDRKAHCYRHCKYYTDYVNDPLAHPHDCIEGERDERCPFCIGSVYGGRLDLRSGGAGGVDNYYGAAPYDLASKEAGVTPPIPESVEEANDPNYLSEHSEGAQPTHFVERWEYEDLLLVDRLIPNSCPCGIPCCSDIVGYNQVQTGTTIINGVLVPTYIDEPIYVQNCNCQMPYIIWGNPINMLGPEADTKSYRDKVSNMRGLNVYFYQPALSEWNDKDYCEGCASLYKERYDALEEAIKQYCDAAEKNADAQMKYIKARVDANTAVSLDLEDYIRDIVLEDKLSSTPTEPLFKTTLALNWWSNAFGGLDTSIWFNEEWKYVYGDYNEELDENKKFMPLVASLNDYDRRYFELWEIYAKNRNLPPNGNFVNWWDLDIQLMFMVDESGGAEFLRTWDAALPKYYNIDTASEYFMREHQGAKNYDKSLPLRTEFAFAVYYLFQYNSDYWKNQMAVTYEDELMEVLEKITNAVWWKATFVPDALNSEENLRNVPLGNPVTWDSSIGSRRADTLLGIVGDAKNMTAVNKLGMITNNCGYIDAPDNSTIAMGALYLANPNYYAPVTYSAQPLTEEEAAVEYPEAVYLFNKSPTIFYEAVFRELWLSEPKSNADWWSVYRYSLNDNSWGIALNDPFWEQYDPKNLTNENRVSYVPNAQQGHPSGWQGDVSMSLTTRKPWDFAMCPFCGKTSKSEEEKKECIKERYKILWGSDVKMSYMYPKETGANLPMKSDDITLKDRYYDWYPTPNTGTGGLLQSDTWFLATLIAWSGSDKYLYDENVGISFSERVDNRLNPNGRMDSGEGVNLTDKLPGTIHNKLAYVYNSDVSKSDNFTAERWNEDYLGQQRNLIAFQPIFKFSDLNFIEKSGTLNGTLTSSEIISDNYLIRNRLFSYLRVVEATEHDEQCVDPTCQGCATPLVQGDRYTRYNGVGYHEIKCYKNDNDPNTVCDRSDLESCPYCYIKNGNQRVYVERSTIAQLPNEIASAANPNKYQGIIKGIAVERVSRNSFFQEGQNDRNATEYRWAEIDMGDWGESKQVIIDWNAEDENVKIDENTLEHKQPGNLDELESREKVEDIRNSETYVKRIEEVLKPGDIILVNNQLKNGKLAENAEFVVWVGARLVESMYPQFDDINNGEKGVFIGTENGKTGPCIRTMADFEKLPNYDNRADMWTVFRCVRPEMDNRYRNAGYYMAEVTQTLRVDYFIYRKEHLNDFK